MKITMGVDRRMMLYDAQRQIIKKTLGTESAEGFFEFWDDLSRCVPLEIAGTMRKKRRQKEKARRA